MVRSKIKAESVDDVQAAIGRVFDALDRADTTGMRYTSYRLPDGVTFVALLEIDDGADNPLPGLPEFQEFQQKLPSWVDGPPAPEKLTLVGTHR